jgi:hypothetical protein
MGLANNELLKGAVDFLTKVLETVNKLLTKLSGGGGIIKTFLTAFTAVKAFKFARSGLNGIANLFGGAAKVKMDATALGQ